MGSDVSTLRFERALSFLISGLLSLRSSWKKPIPVVKHDTNPVSRGEGALLEKANMIGKTDSGWSWG